MRRVWACGLLILIVGSQIGCLSARPPRVELTGAEVLEETDEGARFAIDLMLTNPNDVALPLPEVRYRFQVQGLDSYAYLDLPNRVVGPRGTQTLRLPAALATGGRSLAGRGWSISGRLQYRPDNPLRTFLTETGVPLPVALFSGSGRLP